MSRKQAYRTSCATIAIVALLHNAALATEIVASPVLVPATATGTAGAAQFRGVTPATSLTTQQKIALLRQKVKYVFVIFQENRSFDHYFGTYPGANGTVDASGNPIATNPGYNQLVANTGSSPVTAQNPITYSTIHPFLIPKTVTANGQTVQIYPEDTVSIDHSHTGMVDSAHFVEATNPSTAQSDAYALDEEGFQFASGASSDYHTVITKGSISLSHPNGTAPASFPTLANKQKGEVALGHLDCDTIPFLWNYADRFTLFDNFHQTTVGPSTPNAIAMIAGQTGETQWALHPAQFTAAGTVPITADPGPFAGSNNDHSAVKPAWGPDENPNTANFNLTFASLPLSFMGSQIGQIIKQDENPAADLLDVQHDILTVASKDPSVNWGWYQQGFGPEPFDNATSGPYALTGGVGSTEGSCGNPTTPGYISGCNWPEHASYIVHHNGPQYFGYLGDNTTELNNMHGLQQFFTDMANKALPAKGGVFYVRGGYGNNDGLTPLVPTVAEQQDFVGNDDHPGYSDAFISEAQVADAVNAIASSPYWNESAIIITYDETDGMYDHAPFNVRSWDQANTPLTGGPRIPAIVISPYSAVHTISTQYSEHSSVIKFIDELFGLVPLADLPDEVRGRALGQSELNQSNLGPADDLVSPMGDLTEAFDNDRLSGNAPLLPASYAMIKRSDVVSLPHYGRNGCKVLNILPADFTSWTAYENGQPTDPAPADFNPRPTTAPGIPTSGSWTP
jgi:phospholipase C